MGITKISKLTFVIILSSAILTGAIVFLSVQPPASPVSYGVNRPDTASTASMAMVAETSDPAVSQKPATLPAFLPPVSQALARVTKKTFGIYVTPADSPVSPERFAGFHTGVDFEILPGEENIDVPVSAVCDGELLVKEYANGYGGVAVQSCRLNGEAVTIIYGHLKLSSAKIKAGDKIIAGENIGILGEGYSAETSGERKHLHLGIHKGTAVNILGYVQNKNELANWLDALIFLK